MDIEEVKQEVKKIITEELAGSGYSAFFFGSRVLGTASPTSDLDVGILGPAPVSKDKILSIKARCDSLRTLYKIDVVDFYGTSEDFKKVAASRVEEITG